MTEYRSDGHRPTDYKFRIGDTGRTVGGFEYEVIPIPPALKKMVSAPIVAKLFNIPTAGGQHRTTEMMGFCEHGHLNLAEPIRKAILSGRGLKPNDFDLLPPDASTTGAWEAAGDQVAGALARIKSKT